MLHKYHIIWVQTMILIFKNVGYKFLKYTVLYKIVLNKKRSIAYSREWIVEYCFDQKWYSVIRSRLYYYIIFNHDIFDTRVSNKQNQINET